VRLLHVPNPAWRADGRVLDPARPETLVYWRDPDDRLVLVGVMYTAARGQPGPTIGGPITRWHDHESCRDPATRAKLGRPLDGTCPSGQMLRRSGEMMHVWFTDDLGAAFARRAPLQQLRAFAAKPDQEGTASPLLWRRRRCANAHSGNVTALAAPGQPCPAAPPGADQSGPRCRAPGP
jgi:hypothetical protein